MKFYQILALRLCFFGSYEGRNKKCDIWDSAQPILMKKIYIVDTIRMTRKKIIKKFGQQKSLKKLFEFFKNFYVTDIFELRGLTFHENIFTVSCLTYIIPKVIGVMRHI